MLYSSHPRVSSTNSIFPVTWKPHSNRATRREGEGGTVNESIKGGMGSVGRGTTSRFPLYHPVSTLLYLEFRVGPVSSSYPPLLLSPRSPCNPNKTRDLSYVRVYFNFPFIRFAFIFEDFYIYCCDWWLIFFQNFRKLYSMSLLNVIMIDHVMSLVCYSFSITEKLIDRYSYYFLSIKSIVSNVIRYVL